MQEPSEVSVLEKDIKNDSFIKEKFSILFDFSTSRIFASHRVPKTKWMFRSNCC
jgi:hypothetical protein